MRWLVKKLAWTAAAAAMLAMLVVQTFHSPLSHLGEHVASAQSPSSTERASISASETPCQHVHRHSHGGHCHFHAHSHPPAPSGTDGDEHHHPSHHDCGYCQFLTQTAQPVNCPVLLTGVDVVTIRPVDLTPDVIVIPLSKPYVRGPPVQA